MLLLSSPNVITDERTVLDEQKVRARARNAREAGSASMPKMTVIFGWEVRGEAKPEGWDDLGPKDCSLTTFITAMDGSVRSWGSRTVGGAAAVWAASSPLNSSMALPYPLSSTQMELLGLRLMLTAGIRAGAKSLVVITDSMIAIKSMETIRSGWDIDLGMSLMESAALKGIGTISLEIREMAKAYERIILIHQYAHQGSLDSAGILNNLADLRAVSAAECLLDELRRSAPGRAREDQVRSMILGLTNAGPVNNEEEDENEGQAAQEDREEGEIVDVGGEEAEGVDRSG